MLWNKHKPSPIREEPPKFNDEAITDAWREARRKGLFLYSEEFKDLDDNTKKALSNRLIDNFLKIAEKWTDL